MTDKIFENDLALYRIKSYLNKNVTTGNIVFSQNMHNFFDTIKSIKKTNDEYILYGAGKTTELILELVADNIAYIVDRDETKYNTKVNNKIILPICKLVESDMKVIITVFGHEKKIINMLVEEFNIEQERLLTFDFILGYCE
jgi:hypothetical protein